MTRILLLAHSPLATALQAVAAHTFPDCAAGTDAIDVGPNADLDELEAKLRACVAADETQDLLILADVFGATPCNVAMRVVDGIRVRLVSGVNVPMLWRTLCYQHEPLSALIDRALAGGVQGVMHVAESRRQNQSSPTSAAHDQVDHSHQQ